MHVITDNYEKTFFSTENHFRFAIFQSIKKNHETMKKYSLHVICQISNFKCQIEFEKYSKKSDEMFLCTHNIKNLNHLIAMKKHVIVDI